jgi:hypothetical protein
MKDGVKPGISERPGGVWNPLLRNPSDFERILMTGGSPLEIGFYYHYTNRIYI